MTITTEHKNIQESGLHEPKGVSTAILGQVYISDGAGSGSWSTPPLVASEIGIERLLDASSVASTQDPTGTSDGDAIQVEFGPAQLTSSDPVNLGVDGTLFVNTTGLYRIKVAMQFGRSGGAGVAEMLFRVTVNGTQAGRTIAAKIDSADVDSYFENDSWLELPAGAEIRYEIMRDSSGVNQGGLISVTPTGTWAFAPTAALRVERWSS